MSVKLRAKTLSAGRKSYYLDIFHDGKRQYDFLKIYTKKGALISRIRNHWLKKYVQRESLK